MALHGLSRYGRPRSHAPATREIRWLAMPTSSTRSRALLGGIFSLALVMAPLSLALSATPSGAAAPHAVTTACGEALPRRSAADVPAGRR